MESRKDWLNANLFIYSKEKELTRVRTGGGVHLFHILIKNNISFVLYEQTSAEGPV